MKEAEWVQRETVLALQERLLAGFGGADGIRDKGLLESALSRPLNRFAHEKPTIFELAANYAFGLVRNLPLCRRQQANRFRDCGSLSRIEWR